MIMAFLTINTLPDKMENVLRDIEEITGVKNAYMVFGNYDLIAEVKGKSVEDLRNVILKIRKIPDVLTSLTQMVIK
jgi:DNA-binding Lrp family transcriptional regulator